MNLSNRWDLDTRAIYGVARIGDIFYGKFKLGFLKEEITVGPNASNNIDESDSGLSLGAGIGWRPHERFAMEAEYTLIEEDVNFLSLGAHFFF